MNQSYLIGIDIGTSACKVSLQRSLQRSLQPERHNIAITEINCYNMKQL